MGIVFLIEGHNAVLVHQIEVGLVFLKRRPGRSIAAAHFRQVGLFAIGLSVKRRAAGPVDDFAPGLTGFFNRSADTFHRCRS